MSSVLPVNHTLEHVVDVLEVALKYSLVFGQLGLNFGESSLDIDGVSLSIGGMGFDFGELGSDIVYAVYKPLQCVIEDFSDRHWMGTARKSIQLGSAMDMVTRDDYTYDGMFEGLWGSRSGELLRGHPIRVSEQASRLGWSR